MDFTSSYVWVPQDLTGKCKHLSLMTGVATVTDTYGHQSEIGRFKETKYTFGSLHVEYYQEKRD